MAKEIKFEQKNPKVGDVKGTMRIIGKELFLKVTSYKYARQLLERYKQSGCSVEEGRTWIKIKMFHTHKQIILAGVNFDSELDTDEEIEDKLYRFYMIQYAKTMTKVKGKQL